VAFSAQTFVRPLGIVYRRGRRLNASTEAFIELLHHSVSSQPSPEQASA